MTDTLTDIADPVPYINERRQLEIDVAKARGWKVEPYIATIAVPCSSEVREYDRFRLLDETGAVKGEWGFTAESAWESVPCWATMSAYRDELERHICERFGDICLRMTSTGAVLCVIGGFSSDMDFGGHATGESFEEKGMAVCRAYLQACQNSRAKEHATVALEE